MDIKNALSAIVPSHLKAKDPVDRAIKSGSAADRDGNGQMSSDQQKKKKEPMTDDQFAQALEHLKKLEIVQNSSLQIEADLKSSARLVLVKDASGKVLRRILEEELWALLDPPDKNRGQLLSRAA